MDNPYIQFVVAAAVIAVAGTILARRADDFAELTGLGRLVVGSVLLAAATSLPELSVDITAVRSGLHDVAVGDLMGSSLMNLLVLALIDILQRKKGSMFSRMAAAHALGGMVSVCMMGIAGVAILSTSRLPDMSWLGAHPFLWCVAMAYFFGVRLVFLDQRIAAAAAKEERAEQAEVQHPTVTRSLPRVIVEFSLAAAAIVLAGPRMAHAAGDIAEISGLGGTFVGTTLVAFSTSLPELVASLAALRIGATDLVVGNVFGSNAFNMLLLLPLDMIDSGSLLNSIQTTHAISLLAAIGATSVVVMGQLYQQRRRIPIVEPDAWVVIMLVFAALGIIHQVS